MNLYLKVKQLREQIKELQSQIPPPTRRQIFKKKHGYIPKDEIILQMREKTNSYGNDMASLYQLREIDFDNIRSLELSTEVEPTSDDIELEY